MKKFTCILYFLLFITGFLYAENGNSKKYNRIISLSMAGDEILFDMVDKDRILAFRGKSANNEMVSILGEKIKFHQKVEDNIETIISMEPDLVIIADWLKQEMLYQLQDAGIHIYIYKNPFNYEQQQRLIRELASLLEEEKRGEEIIRNMDNRLEILQKKIQKTGKEPPRVLEYSHYEGTNGKGSMFDDMLQKIYVINVAREAGIGRFSKISKEMVIEMDPDIILVPIWNKFEQGENQKFYQFLKKDKSYGDLKAVKNKKIYPIPGKYIYLYSHYIIEAMEEIAKVIYSLDS